MRTTRQYKPLWPGLSALLAGATILATIAGPAKAATITTTRGVGEGHPPQRADLSPAQRRLMARRASEVRAVRDALVEAVGEPKPGEVRSGTIEVHGRVGSFRVLESQELPDGRWRSVVEVCVPPARPAEVRPDPIGQVLTDYLELRNALVLSREECRTAAGQLERELAEVAESVRRATSTALHRCRADLHVIEWALSDLETKTVTRLSETTTTHWAR